MSIYKAETFDELDEFIQENKDKTTAELLKEEHCYCNHRKKVIHLNDCKLLQGCTHDRLCRKRSITNYDKNLKKKNEVIR